MVLSRTRRRETASSTTCGVGLISVHQLFNQCVLCTSMGRYGEGKMNWQRLRMGARIQCGVDVLNKILVPGVIVSIFTGPKGFPAVLPRTRRRAAILCSCYGICSTMVREGFKACSSPYMRLGSVWFERDSIVFRWLLFPEGEVDSVYTPRLHTITALLTLGVPVRDTRTSSPPGMQCNPQQSTTTYQGY